MIGTVEEIVDVDGLEDPLGVTYVGSAVRGQDGRYRAAGVVMGVSCRVECNAEFLERVVERRKEI